MYVILSIIYHKLIENSDFWFVVETGALFKGITLTLSFRF